DPTQNGASVGIAQVAYNIATLWQQRMLDYELRLAEATNEIVRRGGAPGKRQISIRYLRPRAPLELHILAFDDAAALAHAFAIGAADGAAAPLVRLEETPASEPAGMWKSLRRLVPRKARRSQ
ncbi:MAG TPA: hypothetical protein VMH02_03700, partial [Verrucomicrobiae bacterium]|nr:hypothetical protein [Verrucomicrobiae bacterium]